MSKLISVIIPVYKAEKYLDQCIQSIVDQTYKNLEIILVDDGSPDNCPAICDRWKDTDSRIKVIHKKNGGVSSARNVGIQSSTGDYLAFVDSDDYLECDMYEVMLNCLSNSSYKIACCNYFTVEEEARINQNKFGYKELNFFDAVKSFFRMREVSSAVWDKLFARELIDELHFEEGTVNEEYPLILPLLKKSGGIVHTGTSLYNYRSLETGITGTYIKKDVSDIINHLEEIRLQVVEYGLWNSFKGHYYLFCAKTLLGIGIQFNKYFNVVSEKNRELYPSILASLRRHCLRFVFSRYTSFKNKILYFLTATGLLRPLYKIMRKR